jgi:hypothetical protein
MWRYIAVVWLSCAPSQSVLRVATATIEIMARGYAFDFDGMLFKVKETHALARQIAMLNHQLRLTRLTG